MAAVKATVFYVGGPVAVCSLWYEGGVAVAEASVDPDGTVRILPQTIRPCTVKYPVEVVMPEEATKQDEIDRASLSCVRFRQRLKKFDQSALVGTNTSRLRAQARAVIRDVGRLLPCL